MFSYENLLVCIPAGPFPLPPPHTHTHPERRMHRKFEGVWHILGAAPLLKRLVAGLPQRRPGSRPVLASGMCGGQSGIRACFLRVLQFPLPKPFIPPTSPSSQSPWADTQSPCDELLTRPRSPAGCPRSSNRNETESFMEAAKAQYWAVEPQEKKKSCRLYNVGNKSYWCLFSVNSSNSHEECFCHQYMMVKQSKEANSLNKLLFVPDYKSRCVAQPFTTLFLTLSVSVMRV
jgi:hypothetical protein